MAGPDGQALSADEVCLRASSMLKMLINENWTQTNDDKENVSQNNQQAQTTGQFSNIPINENDKVFVKQNILNCLHAASGQFKTKSVT